ncbi:DUF488 domain-containing protein [Enterococcus nangangensis]|uniref:DUF488 domain-containing protein n=1 Tax=Enterococcus nangangensis TaxID=2559926 RepID=UPI0010F5CACD|nr:DUF488 family protein [Enterococcus nangangensis]
MHSIKLFRVYDGVVKNQKGYKIIVDRLWPRGVKKEDLPYEWWVKELAPSNEVRQAFNHEDDKYATFRKDYLKEIHVNPLAPGFLAYVKAILEKEDVIFLYGAKNQQHNQAVVLKEWLESNL